MLRQSLTYKLVSIAEDAITLSARLFKRRFGIDVHHLRILRLVDDQPGLTFTRLATETKFERTATSRSLGRLIKAGLVVRKNDKNDARRFELFSTAKGRALRKRADPVSLEMERLMLQSLELNERQAFLASLDKLSAWVGGGYMDAVLKQFPDAGKAKPPAKGPTGPRHPPVGPRNKRPRPPSRAKQGND